MDRYPNFNINSTSMKTLIFACISLLAMPLYAQTDSDASSSEQVNLESLSFLVGNWYAPAMSLYEDWVMEDNMIEGNAYFIKNGKKTPFESMQILYVEEDLVMRIFLEGATTDFKLMSTEKGLFVFENKENDFPNQIIYWQAESGVPHAKIEGTSSGQPLTMDFEFQKASDKVEDPLEAIEGDSPLGVQVTVAIGVEDLKANQIFYQKLGFKVVFSDNTPYPISVLTDGSMYITLNQDGQTYFGLTYFSPSIKARKAKLKALDLSFEMETEGNMPMVVIVDPDEKIGIALAQALIPGLDPIPIKSEGACGTFGEIAVPVANLDTAAVWYESIGFTEISKYEKPYPWGLYSDGMMVIGLHQSPHFSAPAITYFSPSSTAEIKRVQALGLDVKDAMPMGGDEIINGVVKSPAGWPVFLFKGNF
ncbi:MAG: catechol 2,3-dioxygenase-like lactoylglutathione lyase family enzyme [Limisphaerales bacterium]|jgi:catechol 2,3-dioxygenase-like lactoylglutathione lyase family enzyme